jgi:3-hydroxyacyl-CoA dehydrogenase
MMRLLEVIEGEDTSDETLQAASNFAQAIRKMPIRCGEVPGFVVNRILISAMTEVWRVTEEEDLDVREVDKAIQESGTVPMGPYFLSDMLGLDTALHVAEHLHESYGGERFGVSKRMKELVEAGNLGQKTGKGFYEHG